MKKIKTGNREEYFRYLSENIQKDRSVMMYNLINKYGLNKHEATMIVRDWGLEGK